MTNSTYLSPPGISTRRVIWFFLIVSLVWLAFNSATLMRYPTVLSDESLVGLVAYRMTPAGQAPSVSHYDPFGVYPFRLYLVGLAQWFKLFGAGVIQGRAFSLLGAFVAGWLIFALGQRLYDSWVGVLAGLIFWFMPRMFWTGHFVRPEIWVTVGNLSLMLVSLRLIRKPTLGLAGLVGFLSLAILDIYLSAMSATFTIGLLVLLTFGPRRQWGVLGAFAGGALLGAIYYLSVQFLPDWQTKLAGWQYWLTSTGHAGPQLSLLQRAWQVPEVFFQLYARYSIIGWLEAGYFLINALILIKRRRQADLFVLGAAGLAFGVFGVAFATPWHTLDTLPMAVMAVAAGLNAGAERLAAMINSLKAHPWPKIDIGLLAVLCAAPLLAGYVGLSFYYVYANRDYDYFGYVKNLQALVPPQAVILGEGTWWWGFINQPYWWDEELANTQPQTPAQAQKLVQDIMAERKITTIFRDENLGLEVQSYGSQSLMETALDQYLSEKCQVTGTVARIAYGIDFNGPGIKRTRIYECHPN